MASAAEQLARNLNFSTFAKAKVLQQRILFTLGALLVYRLGTYIPVPGIDPDAYAATFDAARASNSWFASNRSPCLAANIRPMAAVSTAARMKQAKLGNGIAPTIPRNGHLFFAQLSP